MDHASVAVQAGPTFATASVQTNPPPQKDSDMPTIPVVHEHGSSDAGKVDVAGDEIGGDVSSVRLPWPLYNSSGGIENTFP